MKLRCPTCKQEMTKEQIFKTLSSTTFFKYKQRALELEVAQDEEKIFCPLPECKGIVKGKKDQKKSFPCPECKKLICFFCRSKDHKGTSCEKNRKKMYRAVNLGSGFGSCP